jgi:hypothetical protein
VGKRKVFGLYVRNFWSETLRHRLCDFYVHTRWSDGRLTIREVVDLYGQTGKFDVIPSPITS